MALVVTTTSRQVWGTKRVVFGTLAFDSSYPTGGEAVAPAAKFGLTTVQWCSVLNNSGYSFSYDATNDKVLAYYNDNNNASDGPAIQVPDTTDISALTAVPFMAIGY